jgi:uncharacterized protein
MSRASVLYRLQKIDVEMDKHRALLAQVNAKLANDPVLKKAQTDLAAAEAVLASARQAAKVVDDENSTLSAKLKEVEERLYGGSVTNPRELQDLQTDATSLHKTRDGLDEKQLAAISVVEAAEQKIATAQTALAAAQEVRAADQEVLLRDKGAVDALLEKFEGEREAALISVNAEDLVTYDTLRKQKRVAVGLLVDGICTACGVAPSTNRVMAALAGEDLIRCSSCNRILYAERGGGNINTDDKEDEMIQRW